jgi:hypothetical protein
MSSLRISPGRWRLVMSLTTAVLTVLGSVAAMAVRPAPAAAAYPTCNTWQYHSFYDSALRAQVPAYSTSLDCQLGYGDQGHGVEMLQLSLIYCNNADLSPAWIDGVYGTKTRNVVAWIQGAYGLQVDGVYGPQTRKVLSWLYRSTSLTACGPFA